MAVVISSSLVLGEIGTVPLSHPRILYDNIYRRGTISAGTEETGFAAENVGDDLTWDYWRPTTLPDRIEVQLDEGEEVNCAAIVHNLGTVSNTVKFQYHNGSDWVDLTDEISPGTDHVLMFIFDTVIASRFGFYLTGETSPAEMPSIAIAAAGKALAMERGVTLNHRPITMQRRTVLQNNMSEGGQRLGASIKREGVATQIAFKNIDHDWYRENFDPFAESARVYPFFWAWSPVDYPAEVAFLWLPPGNEDIRPEYADLPDRFDVAFEVEGIVE